MTTDISTPYAPLPGVDFVAVDFETATGQWASICEAGICVVRGGRPVETRSWLVRPYGNMYSYRNIQIHGIRPCDTEHSPEFPEVWAQVMDYVEQCPVLVAHNAVFDMGCIRRSLELYGLPKPDVAYYCSLRTARRLYKLGCHKLDYLCDRFSISYGRHHRAGDDAEMCARLFLKEMQDAGVRTLEELEPGGKKL